MRIEGNVLVIGAGMVGAHLLAQLAAAGTHPVAIDVHIDGVFLDSIVDPGSYSLVQGSILDRERLGRVFAECDVHTVINTAAVLPMRVGHAAHPGFYEVNTWGATSAMFAAVDAGVRRFVQFSTNGVYQFRGNPVTDAVTEDFPSGLSDDNSYGNSKATTEYLLRELTRTGRLDGRIIRPAEIFGTVAPRPGDTAIYWQRMLDAAIAGRDLVVKGEPEHRLDWVYCRDVARLATILAGREEVLHMEYHAALGKVLGIYDWIEALDQVFPGHGVRLEDCGRGGWNHPLSTERASSDLGFEAEYDLVKGIEDYVSWRQRWATAR